jgi:hypothetical protein
MIDRHVVGITIRLPDIHGVVLTDINIDSRRYILGREVTFRYANDSRKPQSVVVIYTNIFKENFANNGEYISRFSYVFRGHAMTRRS